MGYLWKGYLTTSILFLRIEIKINGIRLIFNMNLMDQRGHKRIRVILRIRINHCLRNLRKSRKAN